MNEQFVKESQVICPSEQGRQIHDELFLFPDDPKAALILIADHIDKMQLGVEHVFPPTNDKREPGIGCVQTHTWLHDLQGCAHEARRIAAL